MSQYYFFVSQLPLLHFGQTPPLTADEFRDMCTDYLSPRHLALLAATLVEKAHAPSSPVLESWKGWERSLRNALVTIRAKAKGIDPHAYLKAADYIVGVPETAQEAVGSETPLDAEMVLAKASWRILEDLEVGHHFDEEKLVLYGLKLRILDRISQWTREAGEETFRAFREDMQNQILVGEDPAWLST